MLENQLHEPPLLKAIQGDTHALGFTMASEPLTGSLLRTLAASKLNSRFLELGTGTGLSTAWILDGMDEHSTLLTVDNDPRLTEVAHKHLGGDARLTIRTMDGIAFLEELQGQCFDYIFADTWPGKYDGLDLALNLLNVGGFYIIDDMLPQPNWPPDHPPKVANLLHTLENRTDFKQTRFDWASGLIVMVRTM